MPRVGGSLRCFYRRGGEEEKGRRRLLISLTHSDFCAQKVKSGRAGKRGEERCPLILLVFVVSCCSICRTHVNLGLEGRVLLRRKREDHNSNGGIDEAVAVIQYGRLWDLPSYSKKKAEVQYERSETGRKYCTARSDLRNTSSNAHHAAHGTIRTRVW